MFILGILVFILGLWILLLPANFLKIGQSMSKWITTEDYFNFIDKPRYQESVIYRHHRIAGSLIIIGTVYSVVMLVAAVDITTIIYMFPVVINGFWSEWFYSTTYYILVAANLLAAIVGFVVLIRPSKLKMIEKIMNKWVLPEQKLKNLDQQHNISLSILPGNPRLFGIAITLVGVYIMLSMAAELL